MGKIKTIIKRHIATSSNSLFDEGTNTDILTKVVDKLTTKLDDREEPTGSSGAKGSFRITVDGEVPYLEIKSDKGWVRSDSSSVSGFKFKK
jgi:hypothetical protein|tara:strand:+ start:13 stop:285 length:273 start_codon:yes stop_codon:yes gene_type:complete